MVEQNKAVVYLPDGKPLPVEHEWQQALGLLVRGTPAIRIAEPRLVDAGFMGKYDPEQLIALRDAIGRVTPVLKQFWWSVEYDQLGYPSEPDYRMYCLEPMIPPQNNRKRPPFARVLSSKDEIQIEGENILAISLDKHKDLFVTFGSVLSEIFSSQNRTVLQRLYDKVFVILAAYNQVNDEEKWIIPIVVETVLRRSYLFRLSQKDEIIRLLKRHGDDLYFSTSNPDQRNTYRRVII